MSETSLLQLLDIDHHFDNPAPGLPTEISMRSRCDTYNVTTVRELAASILAKQHYRALYREYGLLGKPLTEGVVPIDGGYSQGFEGGKIDILTHDPTEPHATSTLGAIVEYVGLRCNEPNEAGPDEPYVIISVVCLNPNDMGGDDLVKVHKIGPLEGVVEGSVIGDTQTVWQGKVPGTGLKIGVGVYDHDSGDPDDVREEIEAKVKEYAQRAVSAIAQAYGAGATEADQIAGSEAFTWVVRILSLGVVEIFDLGDDYIGSKSQEIWPHELNRTVPMTEQQYLASLQRTTEGLLYSYKLDMSSDEGDYSVYLRVRGVHYSEPLHA